MSRAELPRLMGDDHVASVQRQLDLVAPLPDDDDALVRAKPIDAVKQVREQRSAGDRVKHFVRVRAHARALPRGKDDDGKTALITHGASNGMALGQAPEPTILPTKSWGGQKEKGRLRQEPPF